MHTTPSDWRPTYARREARMRASEIRELLKLLERPEIISFAGGIPDPALLPTDAARQAYAAILSDESLGAQALQYSTSEGYAPLREWVARHMAASGVKCSADNVLITSGSQQALEFLGKLFVSPADTILTEGPTYLGALQAFASNEPNYNTCLGEGFNTTPEACRYSAEQAGGRVAMAYLVPDFANPTGLTLSFASRKKHIALARDLGIPLVEDAAYTALRYDGEALPSMLALDVEEAGGIDASCVIYCGTFSKVISPGLRVGWIVAAEELIKRLVLIKQASDLNSPLINQIVMHRLAEQSFSAMAERACSVYRERRDAMLAALEHHLGGRVQWQPPAGGLFIWLTLDKALAATRLLDCAVSNHRVALVPGDGFFPGEGGANKIRLSFSQNEPATIWEGIKRLAAAIDEVGLVQH